MIANAKTKYVERPFRDCMRMLEGSLRTGECVNIFETLEFERLDPTSKEFISLLWKNSWNANKK